MKLATRSTTLSAALVAALACAAPAMAQTPAPADAQAAPPAAPAAAPTVTTAAPATGPASADTVVATVNGETITLGQMIAMKSGLHDQAVAEMPAAALYDLMLDQMIRQTAVAQLGQGQMTARDRAALDIDRRAYLSGAAMERIAAAEPTDAELRAVYDKAFPAQAEPKTEYSAAHILVETEEAAKAIADELAKGADFGTLAEERSTDNSGPNKGDLGWFTPDMMVKPFADAVVALEKGAVSAPVQSQFGWHVIKLNDTRTQAAPEFDTIKDQLAMQVRRERVEAAIQSEVGRAAIEKVPGIDPATLNDAALLEK
ncbi:peptidylprolyl isomerase [Paracoccus luteus]|uniref:peptidylprolyl isomerase n=1 Tax=Paracoccus luteus TaxID=2508543 RepID=UPI001FE6052D|nr:peptidylprolyl isomerase [Paracoccus luteus]